MAQYDGKPYQPGRGPEHPLQPAEDPEVHAADAVINHLAVTAVEVEAMNAYKEHEQEVEESEGDGRHGHGEHGNRKAIAMDAEAAVAAAATAAAAAAAQLDIHRAMVSTIVPPPSSSELHPVHPGRSL